LKQLSCYGLFNSSERESGTFSMMPPNKSLPMDERKSGKLDKFSRWFPVGMLASLIGSFRMTKSTQSKRRENALTDWEPIERMQED
jgi:hypothetical protein